MNMCKVLAKNVQTDLDNGIVACVDDESHLNAYLVDKNYLLAGRAYGYPETHLKHLKPVSRAMVKIISRHKESPKYGGVRWLRGQTDRRIPDNWMVRHVLIPMCRIVSLVMPNRKYRRKVKNYFGSY